MGQVPPLLTIRDNKVEAFHPRIMDKAVLTHILGDLVVLLKGTRGVVAMLDQICTAVEAGVIPWVLAARERSREAVATRR